MVDNGGKQGLYHNDSAQCGHVEGGRYSPSAKRLATTVPETGEGLFLGVSSLVSLNVLNAPVRRSVRSERASDQASKQGQDDTDLKRLLQYLQGSVLGLGWRISPEADAPRGPVE